MSWNPSVRVSVEVLGADDRPAVASILRALPNVMFDQDSAETRVVNPSGIPVRILPDSSVLLLEDVTFDVVNLCGVMVTIDVPRGFVCDGASIPRPLWWIVGHPLSGGPLRAAVVHDYLCTIAQTRSERRFADCCFAWIMEEMGIRWWRRTAMYMAVRAYAVVCWRAGA